MAKSVKVLVIDDDPSMVYYMRSALSASGFICDIQNSGCQPADAINSFLPDIIIMDIMLSRRNGYLLLQQIRYCSNLPVIIVSARDDVRDKIKAFNKGADDYIVKPFDLEEFIARINVAIRRSAGIFMGNSEKPRFNTGEIVFDYAMLKAFYHDIDLNLTATEFKILCIYALHYGKLVPNDVICNRLWGINISDNMAKLRVYIRSIRVKLGAVPGGSNYLKTVVGKGYMLLIPNGECNISEEQREFLQDTEDIFVYPE